VDVSHPGQTRMLELIKQNYWWPGIKKYIQECFKCQQNKVQHQKKARELHLLKIPQGFWQEISIDIIGLLPKSNRKDAIVVIIDRFTKMIRLKMTIINIFLEEIAKIYWDKIWKIHGVLRNILSDREPQFTSRFIEEFTKALGITRQLSMAYCPQTDGQTERINQEVGTFLQHYVNYQQDDWTEWLAAAEFQYNDKKHTVMGQTPFMLNFGRHSWKGNLMVQMEFLKLEEFLIRLQRSWKEATKSMKAAQETMKK